MKKKMMFLTAIMSAIALFAGPASADVGRTVGPLPYMAPALGQGDLGGVCLANPPEPPIPPALGSCVEATPNLGETHVEITVTDADGAPVYFSVQQDNNPNFANGCGTLSVPFPVLDSTAGGGAADPVVVFPWAGPGANPDFSTLPPTLSPCTGSTSVAGGTVTFVFHMH
jgi:hypothetical protein